MEKTTHLYKTRFDRKIFMDAMKRAVGEKESKMPEQEQAEADNVNHPPHYCKHPSGVECIQVTEHMNFNLGNAMKYIWRAGEKGNKVEDLMKARWYIDREIKRIAKQEMDDRKEKYCG